MIYLVTYQLKDKVKDYSPLYDKLKSYSDWSHYFDSTWFIYEPNKNVHTISRELHEYLSSSDYLLVSEFSTTPYGWLPKRAWDWINKHK